MYDVIRATRTTGNVVAIEMFGWADQFCVTHRLHVLAVHANTEWVMLLKVRWLRIGCNKTHSPTVTVRRARRRRCGLRTHLGVAGSHQDPLPHCHCTKSEGRRCGLRTHLGVVGPQARRSGFLTVVYRGRASGPCRESKGQPSIASGAHILREAVHLPNNVSPCDCVRLSWRWLWALFLLPFSLFRPELRFRRGR